MTIFRQIYDRSGYRWNLIRYILFIVPALALLSGCVATNVGPHTNRTMDQTKNGTAPGLIDYPRKAPDPEAEAKAAAAKAKAQEGRISPLEVIGAILLLGAVVGVVAMKHEVDRKDDKEHYEVCRDLGVHAPDSCQ